MTDVLTIEDLENGKKHSTFYAEVVTGKVGGLPSGPDISTSTNPVTGQVQKTLPQVLADLGMVVQTWTATSGGTLTNAAQVFLNDKVGSAGLGNYYAWTGTFPKVVTAGLDPAITAGFIMRSDAGLRTQLSSSDGISHIGSANYAQIRSYIGSNGKIYCYGKSNIFDGGDGDFLLDTSDITSPDNGMTVLIDALNRRWKRVFTGVACVEWAEGSTDRLMIKNALAAKIAIQLKPNTDYIWDGTDSLIIDIGHTTLHGNGSRIIFSGFADVDAEKAIRFTSTITQTPTDYWVAQNIVKPVSNLVCIGPKGSGAGAAFSSDCSCFYLDTAHLTFEHVFAYGFGHGVRVSSNAYCISFIASNIGQCKNGVYTEAGGSSYGESIEFFGCKIYDNAVGINNNCQTGVVRMVGGSLDYNVKQIVGTNSSTTELTSAWFECNDAGSGNAHIELSGGSTFRIRGGHVQQNGTPGALAQDGLVRTDSTSTAKFSGVHMFNTKNVANVLDAGSGLCVVEDTDSYPVSYLPSRIASVAGNRLGDGGFAAASVADMWFISSDTAAITDRLNGTNIDIALSTDFHLSGTQSLKISKLAGGAEGAIAVCVPVKAGSRAAFYGNYYKPAGVISGGTIFVTTLAAKIEGVKANGCPNILNLVSFDTLGIGGTDSEIPWTAIGTGMDRIIPSWATHFLVLINAQPFQGDLYFDDFNISIM